MTSATQIDLVAATDARILPLPHPSVHSLFKRCIDLMSAVLALTLGLPAAIIIGIIVAVTSPGPVLFRQLRVGLDGKRFTVWKFRTMTAEATDEAHRDYVLPMIRNTPRGIRASKSFKLDADKRITRFGAWLRKTSLDEYPQFVNVLLGEMSLVGPRPPLDYEVDVYEPWQLERLSVRPGITGWWQVSGRNRMSYVQMCERDIEYVRGWSVGLDVSIIARTPWVMVSNSGRAT
jgi:lipopolysaccharide/colanic/teichoic acid biosynthesis glycosyltransferase